jgi:rRNA maturation endonuclease Nob1
VAKKADRNLQVRCLNCLERFKVTKGVEKESCPKCGMEWRIAWHDDGMAKIRGPVWSKVNKETGK